VVHGSRIFFFFFLTKAEESIAKIKLYNLISNCKPKITVSVRES
jgi:hypothetical protein